MRGGQHLHAPKLKLIAVSFDWLASFGHGKICKRCALSRAARFLQAITRLHRSGNEGHTRHGGIGHRRALARPPEVQCRRPRRRPSVPSRATAAFRAAAAAPTQPPCPPSPLQSPLCCVPTLFLSTLCRDCRLLRRRSKRCQLRVRPLGRSRSCRHRYENHRLFLGCTAASANMHAPAAPPNISEPVLESAARLLILVWPCCP